MIGPSGILCRTFSTGLPGTMPTDRSRSTSDKTPLPASVASFKRRRSLRVQSRFETSPRFDTDGQTNSVPVNFRAVALGAFLVCQIPIFRLQDLPSTRSADRTTSQNPNVCGVTRSSPIEPSQIRQLETWRLKA